ncbi:MAG TPA: hypothetical protein PLY86_20250 [bacterium]|nr:hypothetical protein [bacterium]
MENKPVIVWVTRGKEKVQRWLVEDFGDTLIVEDANGCKEQVPRDRCEIESKRGVLFG